MSLPVINRIMANIASVLATVTTGNGYNTTITAVDRAATLPSTAKTGTAYLRYGPDEITPENDVPSGWTEHKQQIDILVCLTPNEDDSAVDDTLRLYSADILKALRADITRGNNAIDTKPGPDDELYQPEGSFYEVARVVIQYRHLWDDPTLPASF